MKELLGEFKKKCADPYNLHKAVLT